MSAAFPRHRIPEEGVTHLGVRLRAAACRVCGAAPMLFAAEGRCPFCGGATRATATETVAGLPEVCVPRRLTATEASRSLASWASEVAGLDRGLAAALEGPATPVWLPMWCLDATVRGSFSCDVGWNEPTRSTWQKYERGAWRSVEQETSTARWEPRVGTLDARVRDAVRHADVRPTKVSVWALLADHQPTRPVTSGDLEGSVIPLPQFQARPGDVEMDRLLSDAVGALIARAAGADRAREVVLKAETSDLHLTLGLLPAWTVRWVDESGHGRAVLLDDRTGDRAGPRPRSRRGSCLTWPAVHTHNAEEHALWAKLVRVAPKNA